jgi:hypothetical protein
LGINKKKQFVLKFEIKIKNFLKTFLYELKTKINCKKSKIICKVQPIDQKYLQKFQKELQNCVFKVKNKFVLFQKTLLYLVEFSRVEIYDFENQFYSQSFYSLISS